MLRNHLSLRDVGRALLLLLLRVQLPLARWWTYRRRAKCAGWRVSLCGWVHLHKSAPLCIHKTSLLHHLSMLKPCVL